jgi:hypothetical protein
MLGTPGCWARDEIGALLAGVFCGVLRGQRRSGAGRATYGALRSTGWFLKGAAMMRMIDEITGAVV